MDQDRTTGQGTSSVRRRGAGLCSKQRESGTRQTSLYDALTILFASASSYLSLRPANLSRPRLPTHFSPTDKSALLSVSPSGFTVSFIPRVSRDGEQDAAAIRANAAIDPTCGLYYYEVEIVSAGERGYIGIGSVREDRQSVHEADDV